MDFNKIDKQLRIYETFHDLYIPPNNYIVVRLDGRNFTKLTKESMNFNVPFDSVFNKLMIGTVKHLMLNSGFNIKYGYTESDEISFLLADNDNLFNHKTRKINSILAGEASAIFTKQLNKLDNGNNFIGVFDCRVSILPSIDLIIDYFRWRMEDAHRNSLNSYVYWIMRKKGLSKNEATKRMFQMSVANKNEYLFLMNINYNDLPLWQKRGIGFYWKTYFKKGINPKTEEKNSSAHRNLIEYNSLPINDEYDKFLNNILGYSFT